MMPNHVHGTIVIRHDDCRGEVASPIAVSPIPKTKQGGDTPPLRRHTLGQIVAFFKYQSAKQINHTRNTAGVPLWQRNYYEHIIRGEEETDRICTYIIENPMKWGNDEDNPETIEKLAKRPDKEERVRVCKKLRRQGAQKMRNEAYLLGTSQ